MTCLHCPHCMTGDNAYAAPEAVELGRQVPLVKLPSYVTQYYLKAPAGAMSDILEWVDGQAGTRGRRVLGDLKGLAIVTDDGVWTEQHMPQAPIVRRKIRRVG